MPQDSQVWLKNWNSTKTEVFAVDGDSVQLMPESKTLVDRKFMWNMPKGVEEYRENFKVFGKKKQKEVNTTKDSGNLANASDDRLVLKTEDSKPS